MSGKWAMYLGVGEANSHGTARSWLIDSILYPKGVSRPTWSRERDTQVFHPSNEEKRRSEYDSLMGGNTADRGK